MSVRAKDEALTLTLAVLTVNELPEFILISSLRIYPSVDVLSTFLSSLFLSLSDE
jgi:hypothetical protein